MGIRRLGGTLAALLFGGAVVAGGATAVPVAGAVAGGGVVAAVVAYALGDRRYPLAVAVALYLGTGAAILVEAIAVPPRLAVPLLGIGGLLAVAFLVRNRLGNARRVATLPVDPSGLRRREAGVARRILVLQSGVGRVADAGVGSVRVGAAVLVLAWTGVVAGTAFAWTELARPAALAAESGLLLALLVPFYWGTDWTGVDAPDGPADSSLGARLRAVGAAFRRERPTSGGAGGAADPTAAAGDPTHEERVVGDGARPVAPADGDTGGGAASEGSTDDDGRADADEDVAELPAAEEIGPASWGPSENEGTTEQASTEGATEGTRTLPAGDGPGEAETAEADDVGGGGADGDGDADGDGNDVGDEHRRSTPSVPDADEESLPGVPEVGSEATGEGWAAFDLGVDEDGDEEDADDDVLAILEERDDPEPIDADASPAKEAFGIYDRVSEILGSSGSEASEWTAEGTNDEDGANGGDDGDGDASGGDRGSENGRDGTGPDGTTR